MLDGHIVECSLMKLQKRWWQAGSSRRVRKGESKVWIDLSEILINHFEVKEAHITEANDIKWSKMREELSKDVGLYDNQFPFSVE